jgi:hypothetical protein
LVWDRCARPAASGTADFLNRLDDLITDGGEVLPVSQVLGIRPDDAETNALVQRRIGELWDGVESGAQQWLDRYGPPDVGRRP